MTSDDPTRNRTTSTELSRRTVLGALGATVVGTATLSTSDLASAASDVEYRISQGPLDFSVTPFEGTETVEELYDLRVPSVYGGDNGASDPGEGPYFESVGTQDLQQEDTTITFLYDGPQGLSLVVVHDSTEGDGGSVTWELTGVPQEAEWAVKDELYLDPDDGTEDNVDNWNTTGTDHQIDWTWADFRTDGGALRSLGSDFEIEITPRYNEEAALWNEYYTGEVTDWQILSGSMSDPKSRSLTLYQPVTISAESEDDNDTGGNRGGSGGGRGGEGRGRGGGDREGGRRRRRGR